MEQAAKNIVWDLHLPFLEDDIGKRNDNWVDCIELQADGVGVKHSDSRVDNLDAVQSKFANHKAHSKVRLLV